MQFVIHHAADRARLRDHPDAARTLLPDDVFTAAMAYGALVAPADP